MANLTAKVAHAGRHGADRGGWPSAQLRPGRRLQPGYARYIGRVGALAVALGVGVAVATTPGIARADDTAPASPDTTDSVSTADSPAPPGAGTGPAAGPKKSPPKAVISNTGGAHTSSPNKTATTGDEAPATAGAEQPTAKATPLSQQSTTSATARIGSDTVAQDESATAPVETPAPRLHRAYQTDRNPHESENLTAAAASAPYQAAPPTLNSGALPATSAHPTVIDPDEAAPTAVENLTPAADPAAESVVTQSFSPQATPEAKFVQPVQPASARTGTVLPGALRLAPLSTDTPQAPPAAPIELIALAAVRRQQEQDLLQQSSVNTPDTSALVDTTQPVALTASTTRVAPAAKPVKPPKNTKPDAADDTGFTTTQGTPLTITAPEVLGNDSDADLNTLTARPAGQPANGTVSLDSNGSFIYTPNATFTGTDTFSYKADDGKATSKPANVTITVTGAVNNPPVAANDTYSTDEDNPLTVTAPGVLANDSDPDANPMTTQLVSGPGHGTLTLNSNGSFTYNPTTNYNGPDSFTYRVTDGSDIAQATVSLTVNPVNDAPTAVDDSAATNENTPLTINAPGLLTNDSDVEGSPLTAVLVAPPAHGVVTVNPNGSFTYTPAADYSGPDSFTYKANDGALDSAPATVNLTVTAGNAAPVITSVTAGAVNPTAGAITYTLAATDDNTPVGVLGVSVTQPAGGTVATPMHDTSSGTWAFTYTPTQAARYGAAATFGPDTDSFTVSVDDGHGGVTSAPVNVTIEPLVDDQNAAPVLSSVTTNTPNAFTGVVTGRVIATDPDGDTPRYLGSTSTELGRLVVDPDGSFTFTPTDWARAYAAKSPNYNGALLTITVTDGHGGALAVPVVATIAPALPFALVDNPTTLPEGSTGPPGGFSGPPFDTVQAIRGEDFIALPQIGLVFQGLVDVDTQAIYMKDGREVLHDRPCTGADPCQPGDFDYQVNTWTRNNTTASPMTDPSTGLPVVPDVYLLTAQHVPRSNPSTNGFETYVVGYQKLDEGQSVTVIDEYVDLNGYFDHSFIVRVLPGTFPTQLFGPGATLEQGGLTDAALAQAQDQLEVDWQNFVEVRNWQEETRAKFAAFSFGVDLASNLVTAFTPASKAPKVKAVLTINDQVVVSDDVQLWQQYGPANFIVEGSVISIPPPAT